MLYKKVDASSAEVVNSGLDFFSTPPTNCAVANSSYREYLTLNPISSRPFHFKAGLYLAVELLALINSDSPYHQLYRPKQGVCLH